MDLVDFCSHQDCEFSKFGNSKRMPLTNIKCFGCNKWIYHSEIFMFNDHKHFSICAPANQSKNVYALSPSRSIIKYSYYFPNSLFISSEDIRIDYDRPLGSGGFGSVKIVFSFFRCLKVLSWAQGWL